MESKHPQNELYPAVMYDMLGSLERTMKPYDRDSYLRQKQNLSHALNTTGQSGLLDSFLEQDDLTQELTTDFFNSCLHTSKLKKALKILRRFPKQIGDFDHDGYCEKLAKQGDEALINDFWELISQAAVEEAQPYQVRRYRKMKISLIENLWENRQLAIAQKLIQSHYTPAEQKGLQSILAITYQKAPVTEETIEILASLETEKTKKGYISNSLFNLIITEDVDIRRQKAAADIKPDREDYALTQRLINWYLEQKDFAAAEAIAGKWDQEEIQSAKMAYAADLKDTETYQDGLDKILARYDTIIQETQEREGNIPYHQRIEGYEAQAQKAAELALFELRFGSEEAGLKHIKTMIDWVEQIKVPGQPDCPPEHQISLNKNSRSLKRNLKRRFQESGYLELLPRNGGWNTAQKIIDYDQREVERRARKEKRWQEQERRQSDAQKKGNIRNKKRLTWTKKHVEAGKLSAALNLLEPWSADWEKACIIVSGFPEQYDNLIKKLLFRGSVKYFFESFHNSHDDYDRFFKFIATAHATGIMDKPEREEFASTRWEDLIEQINESRFDPDAGRRNISFGIVTNLVRNLIEVGDLSKAWEVFNRMRHLGRDDRTQISPTTENVCLSYFIEAVADHGANCGIHCSFAGKPLPQSASNATQLEYWNTEAEKSCHQAEPKNYEQAIQKLQSALEKMGEVRRWTRLMTLGSIRSPHQKKDELQAVYQQAQNPSIRWRIVHTMIAHRLPGAESMAEIKSQETPIRVTKVLFEKLVEQGFLHEYTRHFLDEENIPWLRRLLSEFQNEFNTVMETLESYFPSKRRFNEDESERAEFKTDEWEKIIMILRRVKVFTPGIYDEARQHDFDEQVIDDLSAKMQRLKQKMFKNQSLGEDISPELAAEVVYAAFRPANMSLQTLRNLFREIPDCSHHLDQFCFNSEGYLLNLDIRKTMSLPNPDETLPSRWLCRDLSVPQRDNKEYIQETSRMLCELGRLKIPQADGVFSQILSSVFDDGSFFKEAMHRINLATEDQNETYTGLRECQEALGVYLEDNLQAQIETYFEMWWGEVSGMVTSLSQSFANPKRARVLKEQLGIEVDRLDPNPKKRTAAVIAQVIIKKFKPLQQARKMIRDDFRKFRSNDGSKTIDGATRLRAMFSKNQASFFAKASAGICTDKDVRLFAREDHLHINIIDETKGVCVGNVQAYVMEHKGEPYLLLRGFNPSNSVLKDIDAASFCEAVIDIGTKFAKSNGLRGVMLSEQGSFHALSNRNEVLVYLEKSYQQNQTSIEPFQIASSRHANIDTAYLVLKAKHPTA